MPEQIPALDRALRFLDVIRNEFRQRIELKQQVFSAYILGLAAIFSFVFHDFFSHPEILYLLWIVPFLSLSAATFYADHMLVTTSLSNYIKHQLEPVILSEPLQIEFWDRAEQSRELVRTFGLLSFVHSCIICLPPIAVMIIEWQFRVIQAGKPLIDTQLNSILNIYAAVCVVASMILMVIIHRESKKAYGRAMEIRETKKGPTPPKRDRAR